MFIILPPPPAPSSVICTQFLNGKSQPIQCDCTLCSVTISVRAGESPCSKCWWWPKSTMDAAEWVNKPLWRGWTGHGGMNKSTAEDRDQRVRDEQCVHVRFIQKLTQTLLYWNAFHALQNTDIEILSGFQRVSVSLSLKRGIGVLRVCRTKRWPSAFCQSRHKWSGDQSGQWKAGSKDRQSGPPQERCIDYYAMAP